MTPTIVDHDAYAEWAAEHHPQRCSLTIVVPVDRVDSDDFQRVITRLSLIATRFDTEVDADLLGELVAAGQTVPGVAS